MIAASRFLLSRQSAFLLTAAMLATIPAQAEPAKPLIGADVLAKHVERFNTMEHEGVINAVPDAKVLEWLEANVPRFVCPDATVEEIYWFRWWALRKHLQRDEKTGKWVFTEFINRKTPVSSALGHHLMELRWLHNQEYANEYVDYWLRGNNGKPMGTLHKYSQWFAYALWQRALVTGDWKSLIAQLDDLVADYKAWEKEKGRPDGLFWNYDVRDAMEESISGGRKVENVRPTISVYMYGNALALADIARRAGRDDLAKEYAAKADDLREKITKTLWDPEREFFTSRTADLKVIPVREEIGFIPWYFGQPQPGKGYEVAWKQFTDEEGFKAPWGITTAERRDPTFRSRGTGTCEWDGAIWPFATSQTLTALAKVIRDYPQEVVTNADWFDSFRTYTKSHVYDGLPYIGEYQDENTGAWLKGRDARSFYYNHSTYADLLITGLVGLVPRADDTVEVNPLLPAGTWDWFCLENVKYHGRNLTIIWDRDGKRFGRGAGLTVLADGKQIAHSEKLERVTGQLP
jgi:hypothetical protein